MNKVVISAFLLLVIVGPTHSMKVIDSVDLALIQKIITLDTNRVNDLLDKSTSFGFSRPDSSLYFARQALDLARKLNFANGERLALQIQGEVQRILGDYPESLESQFRALELSRSTKQKLAEAYSLGFIGFSYSDWGEYRLALQYLFAAKAIYEQHPDPTSTAFNLSNIGGAYAGLGLLDSALVILEDAWVQAQATNHQNLMVLTLLRLGGVRSALGNHDEALLNYHAALKRARKDNDRINPSQILLQIAQLHLKLNQNDSSLYYARLALADAKSSSQGLQILKASDHISNIHRETSSCDSTLYYQDIVLAMKDSLFGPSKFRQIQVLALREQQRKLDLVHEQDEFRNQSRLIGLSGILIFVLAIAFILYKNNRRKHKVNLILEEQKVSLEQALHKLKGAQAQLIQSEKMVSLGELTAGIAHEIQNPLNFVNNFSEVNKELASDLEGEIDRGNYNDAKALAKNIRENEDKITHHGKRADAIVKGMLQHSRSSSGVKEPTDISALCEEYLRLAYHGLRAKDKTFNAKLETDFDSSLGKINVVPQDIGRVVLNLINNAFYAVAEKKKQLSEAGNADDFEPTISITTNNLNSGKVIISIKDNGHGIPASLKEKIFQPFFTTKPAGQGTGLGLSLSYDIVKAHGGELKIETEEGEGSKFTVLLPI